MATKDSAIQHSGSRLVGIYELLELCLLEMSNEEILLAQRVSKRFHSIIKTSPRIQEKLFFTCRLDFKNAFKAKLNPVIMREDVRAAIPLFFDDKQKRLAYRYQDGLTRLHCRSITATTVWVYLEFSLERPCHGFSGEIEEDTHQMRMSRGGSWERMYLSQPSCYLSWRVRLPSSIRQHGRCSFSREGETEEIYTGIVKGERTIRSLLDGLVESLVIR